MRKTGMVLIFLFYFHTAFSQLQDSLKHHIDTAISIMRDHSLYASRVNWNMARQEAYKNAEGAKNKEQLFDAIAGVYRQLNDHHGWFEQYSDKIKLTDSAAIKRYSASLLKEWAKGPKIKAQLLNNVSYLRLPGMPAYNQKQIDFYANWLADSISSLAAKQPIAWIIDLRLNTGGNITPMMGALATFFKNGIVSYYVDRNNKAVSKSVVKDRTFYLDDSIHVNLKHNLPDLSKAKIAIIIGAGTGSSGEGVAANFKEREYTQLFGERTAGEANSTEGFVFNNDNSYFLLTTSKLGNKNMKPLPEYVSPHTPVTNNDSFEDLMNDNAIKAALKWINH